MRKPNALLTVAGITCCILMGMGAGASSPERVVKHTIVRLSRILEIEQPQKRTARLIDELRRSFDYKGFEARVIQDAKSKLSPEQKKRFSKAFRKMFERKITALADDPNIRCTDYNVSSGDNETEVMVSCVQSTSTEQVRLHFPGPNATKIVDITFSGALLSRNYRGIINKLLRRDGAEALIVRIESKSADSLTQKSLL
ncbi:MAG: ABC transporter substrate-binding protein [Deltaproteobacteria bacterium]|nr:ABC transporter substrate-binding protein [Deltaproteobacteria bacterium]MBN2670564.1 ABC transporter substrate-binding protein [Deltaproteobacteria bacterium]